MKYYVILISFLMSLLAFAQDKPDFNVQLLRKSIARDRKKYESDLDKLYVSVIDLPVNERIYLSSLPDSCDVTVNHGIAVFPNGIKYPISNNGVEYVSCRISNDGRNLIYDSVLRFIDAEGIPLLVSLPLDPYHLKVFFNPNNPDEFHCSHNCKNLESYTPSKSVALGDFIKVHEDASMCLLCAHNLDFLISVIYLPD